MRKNVLTVAYVLPNPDLGETFIWNEIRAVSSNEALQVIPVYARPDGSKLVRPVPTAPSREPLRFWSLGDLLFDASAVHAARSAARLLEKIHVDIVHAHFVNFPARVAAVLGHYVRAPATATAHAADYLMQPGHRLRRTVANLDHLFAISNNACERLSSVAGRSKCEVSVVRAAVDPRMRLHPVPDSAVECPRRPRIVTVARLVPKKGIDDCVKIAAQLRSRGLDFEWLIIGDGPLMADTKERIEQAKLTDSMIMKGSLPNQEVLELIRGATAAVLPCRQDGSGDEDGIPVFLIESAALGVPIVSTSVGGISDLMKSAPALLFGAGDVAGLSNAVADLVSKGPLGSGSGERLRQAYESEFAPHLQVERYLSVWSDLVSRNH